MTSGPDRVGWAKRSVPTASPRGHGAFAPLPTLQREADTRPVVTEPRDDDVMRHGKRVDSWRAKTAEAVASAKELLERGLCDGAVDRAYFAMLYVVYLALRRRGVAVGTPRQRGLVHRAFRAELARAEPGLADLAVTFDRAEAFRWIADYGRGDISAADAAGIVVSLDDFIARTERAFASTQSEDTAP